MKQVLVIDDDRLARQSFISYVDWSRCKMNVVGEAANGKQALSMLKDTSVDLAIVDLAMPIMDGLTFIRESRNEYPDLSYVVLSFHEDFDKVREAFRLGALDYISKMQANKDDYTSLLEDISRRLPLTTSYPELDSRQTGIAAWSKVEEKWNHLHWLHSESVFQSLLAASKETCPSLQCFEHFLVRLHLLLQNNLSVHVPDTIPTITDYNTACSWLRFSRDDVLTKVKTIHPTTQFPAEMILISTIYMNEHLSDPLSLESVAKVINISRSYFSAQFKKYVGKTFNHYLRDIRMEEAEMLLAEGNLNLCDVACRVGYEDCNYFVRVFTEAKGATPTEFRRTKNQFTTETY